MPGWEIQQMDTSVTKWGSCAWETPEPICFLPRAYITAFPYYTENTPYISFCLTGTFIVGRVKLSSTMANRIRAQNKLRSKICFDFVPLVMAVFSATVLPINIASDHLHTISQLHPIHYSQHTHTASARFANLISVLPERSHTAPHNSLTSWIQWQKINGHIFCCHMLFTRG